MNKKEFNKYCAEVMGYKVEEFSDLGTGNPLTGQDETYLVFGRSIYDPYDDLNQMVEAFDKLWYVEPLDESWYFEIGKQKNIKQAMRDFIESTRGSDE